MAKELSDKVRGKGHSTNTQKGMTVREFISHARSLGYVVYGDKGFPFPKEEKARRATPISLVPNDPKYFDKHVALASFSSRKIVAFGEDASQVIEEARNKGYNEPVLFYVPDPNVDQIYAVA